MYSKEGEDAILTWVKSFPFGSEVTSLEELANGSIMAKILNRLVFWLVHFSGQRNLVIFHHISSIYNLSSFRPMKMRGLILLSRLRILIETTHMVEQKSKNEKRVDPEFFSEAEFINRLVTTDCGNVDLCLLNAAKVVERVSEYYRDCLQWTGFYGHFLRWPISAGPFQLAHFRWPIFLDKTELWKWPNTMTERP